MLTVKIPNTGSHIPLFGSTEILYTPIGLGSSAFAAAVPYLSISDRGEGVSRFGLAGKALGW